MLKEHQPLDFIIIYTSIKYKKQINKLAKQLIDQHLAACVSAKGWVSSCYRWEDKISNEMELQVTIKTTARHLPAIKHFLSLYHPYSLPELWWQYADGVSQEYLQWVIEQTNLPS